MKAMKLNVTLTSSKQLKIKTKLIKGILTKFKYMFDPINVYNVIGTKDIIPGCITSVIQ